MYNLAKYLAKKLEENYVKPESYVKDSCHLIEILKKQKLETNDLLVSFDVESLFTNIPIEETLMLLKDKFNLDNAHLKLARLCLGSTYFCFNGKMYEQTEGAAMGSPLSPLTANIFMQNFEETFVMKPNKKPTMWLRYVDDCLIIWKHGKDELKTFLNILTRALTRLGSLLKLKKITRSPF
jgi:hypothetical protein